MSHPNPETIVALYRHLIGQKIRSASHSDLDDYFIPIDRYQVVRDEDKDCIIMYGKWYGDLMRDHPGLIYIWREDCGYIKWTIIDDGVIECCCSLEILMTKGCQCGGK